MVNITYSSRRDAEESGFHPLAAIGIPLLAIFLQAYLPLRIPDFAFLDLPLIVTIFFAVSRRNAIYGTLTGMLIGLTQDALTHHPLGINGISKSFVGFVGASIVTKVDTENVWTRLLLNFVFTLVNSSLYFLIVRYLLARGGGWIWQHELIRAVSNAVVGVPIFYLLDLTKKRPR